MAVLLCCLAALLGASLGSFAGVVADRGWRASLTGRSRCASCERPLRWFDEVPLVSYVVLRARCRRCGAHIPVSVLLWEAGGAVVALAVAVPLVLVAGRL